MRRDKFMRVLVYQEDGFTVAQGLDSNIVASVEGDDIDRLIARFALQAGLNKDLALPPVPSKFEAIWQKANELAVNNHELTVRLVA